jgi:murein DD-endopeptidase MepM/ murein hydrolase activator NlpD
MTQLYRLDIKDGVFTFTPHAPDAERVLFASPVTGVVGEVWGGAWFDATGYCKYYESKPGVYSYHTGCDLNMPNYADAGKPVYAAADGVVKFCGQVTGWQGDVVVIEHVLEDGSQVWTRYAHITHGVGYNQIIKCGAVIGHIADYNKDGAKGDHLHYDVARIDLGVKPGDWPGDDKARVLRDYHDPAQWHKAHA